MKIFLFFAKKGTFIQCYFSKGKLTRINFFLFIVGEVICQK